MAGKTRIGVMKQTSDYLQNITKEYKQWKRSNPSGPGPEAGQFWGAVLQGRRYDKRGRQK